MLIHWIQIRDSNIDNGLTVQNKLRFIYSSLSFLKRHLVNLLSLNFKSSDLYFRFEHLNYIMINIRLESFCYPS
jgi:hypothetical protein